MSRSQSAGARTALLAIVALAAAAGSAGAQETVTISVPLAISFPVTDVSRSTGGTPSVTRIGFSNANLSLFRILRVSVQSDAGSFTPPSGSSIPASKVSWNIVGTSGGIGLIGTLSSSFYALVFLSNPIAIPGTSGYVDLSWTLAAPGTGIHAGNHQLTLRWKLESITP